jgi:hypothetical protein
MPDFVEILFDDSTFKRFFFLEGRLHCQVGSLVIPLNLDWKEVPIEGHFSVTTKFSPQCSAYTRRARGW